MAGSDGALGEAIGESLRFDNAHYAHGSSDSFYTAPSSSASASPGTLLRVEASTDATLYHLPPGVALSRIIYQSLTLFSRRVPVSAAILWPYAPRSGPDGKFQVVAWAHGTSGISPKCAPSNMKNLWNHYLAPFPLALQGYVVVCTDYSGIGVGVDANGTRIQHEYLCSVSQAHDVFYSVQAAREAFPELSKSFVVVGHSQGGSAAWGCAQRQGIEPMEGYLGAVAVSPVTHMMSEAPSMAEIITAVCVPGIEAAFEKFDRRMVMTDEGMRRIDMICDLHANEPLITLLTGEISLLQDGWREDPSILEYQKRTETRGKKIEGPLLVIFGEADPFINIELCAKAVEDTAGKFPNALIEFVRIPNVSHAASLTSSQQIWLKWTEDRFAGEPTANGLTQTVLTSARPYETYQPEMTWYIESKTAFYQV